jgi:hypothetical protein
MKEGRSKTKPTQPKARRPERPETRDKRHPKQGDHKDKDQRDDKRQKQPEARRSQRQRSERRQETRDTGQKTNSVVSASSRDMLCSEALKSGVTMNIGMSWDGRSGHVSPVHRAATAANARHSFAGIGSGRFQM